MRGDREAGAAPPRPIGRPAGRLDNIALVPASLLPFKAQWQVLADGLPVGGALLVIPAGGTRLKQTMRRLAPELRARGRHITTLPAEHFV